MEQIVKNYTFNPDQRTVQLTDYTSINLERLLLITDVTRNIVLYDADNPSLNATVAGNTITLTYNMSSSNFSASDKLRVVYNPASGDPVDQPTLPTGDLGYPAGATPLAATSGNVAAAIASATLAKAAGKTTYITGFTVSGAGATLGLPVIVTVVGILGGTLSYVYSAAAGVLLGNTPLTVTFPKPVPASGTNVDIVVSCPSLGTGNTNNSVVATGFRV